MEGTRYYALFKHMKSGFAYHELIYDDKGKVVNTRFLDVNDIFEDFYQVGNSHRDKREGLGLGLGIVRRLAALLGHGLQVWSHLGKGSVLSVTVPLSRTDI